MILDFDINNIQTWEIVGLLIETYNKYTIFV